jgi:hypothetical protein
MTAIAIPLTPMSRYGDPRLDNEFCPTSDEHLVLIEGSLVRGAKDRLIYPYETGPYWRSEDA